MAAGVVVKNGFDRMNPPVKKQAAGVFDAYGGAINETAANYDEMMGNYRDILAGGTLNGSPGTYKPISVSTTRSGGGGTSGGESDAPSGVQNYVPAGIPASILYQPQVASAQINYAGQGKAPVTDYTGATVTGAAYNQSQDTTNALRNLQSLSNTGGYSDIDIQNIRERGISPIRSIYSSAQEGLGRQKALQGGYSPNQAAASAKMAREMSGQLSAASTKVNADLAESIARNKMQATEAYGSASSAENSRRAAIDQANAALQAQVERDNAAGRQRNTEFNTTNQLRIDADNAAGLADTNKFNVNNINDVNAANTAGYNQVNQYNADAANKVALENARGRNAVNSANSDRYIDVEKYNNGLIGQTNDERLKAMAGMTSLYGTTPALANTFGDQALKQQEINNRNAQAAAEIAAKNQQALLAAYGRG